MDLPIGLVFEIMLFRSPFYRKTLDSVLRLRFSPTDTHFTHFCLRLTVPAGRISLTNRFRAAGEHDAVSRVHILNRCAIRRMELFALHIADIPAFQFRTRRFNRLTALFNGKGNLLSIRPADDRSILVRSIDRRIDIAQAAQNLLVRMTIAVIRAAADDSVSRHDFPQENIGA